MPASDLELMRAALIEARKAGRETRPNPRVGAALLSARGELVVFERSEMTGNIWLMNHSKSDDK